MPVRVEDTACPFCNEPDRDQVEIDRVLQVLPDPSVTQRLHRHYSVITRKELLDFLWFISQHVPEIEQHVHFKELSDFAEGQIVLDWGTSDGRYVEAVFHLCVDAHLEVRIRGNFRMQPAAH